MRLLLIVRMRVLPVYIQSVCSAWLVTRKQKSRKPKIGVNLSLDSRHIVGEGMYGHMPSGQLPPGKCLAGQLPP